MQRSRCTIDSGGRSTVVDDFGHLGVGVVTQSGVPSAPPLARPLAPRVKVSSELPVVVLCGGLQDTDGCGWQWSSPRSASAGPPTAGERAKFVEGVPQLLPRQFQFCGLQHAFHDKNFRRALGNLKLRLAGCGFRLSNVGDEALMRSLCGSEHGLGFVAGRFALNQIDGEAHIRRWAARRCLFDLIRAVTQDQIVNVSEDGNLGFCRVQ